MLVFSDGYVQHHGYHQTSDNDITFNDPLDTNRAQRKSTWKVSSPDDPSFAKGIPAASVGRKSKGNDFSRKCKWNGKQCDNDVILEHWIFLKLPKPMKKGCRYSVPLSSLAKNTNIASFLFDEARTRSEAVHVNQIGYIPSAEKKFAYVSMWLGSAGGLDLKDYLGTPFSIIRIRDSSVMFTGKLAFRKAKDKPDTGATVDEGPSQNFTGADVYECDFSGFLPEDGDDEYVVSVERIGCSFPFGMKADIYREAFRTTVRGLFHERSGIALDKKYTDWDRPRDHHPDDGITIWYSKHTILEFKTESDIKELKANRVKPVKNVWGWYHDAGDWDGYISHAIVPRYLMTVYEMRPGNFKDNELNIPESGNGIPDILDEASWLLNFDKRAKGPTGGICGGRVVEDEEAKLPEGTPSWEDKRDWYASGEDPLTTFKYASLAAQYSFCLSGLTNVPSADAKGWLKEAETAYAWAVKNSAHWEKQVKPSRLLAEAWLYKTTGNKKYHAAFLDDITAFGGIDPEASSPRDEQWAVWAYLTTKRERDQSTVEKYTAMALRWADDMVVKTAFGPDPSGGPGRGMREGWHWWVPTVIGFNSTPHVIEAIVAFELTKKTDYLDAVRTTCDYMLGGNGMNMCWVSGLGDRSPRELMHLDSWYGGHPTVIPGIVPYAVLHPDKSNGYFWNGPWSSEMNWDHMYPSKFQWPMHEGYCENRYCPISNEFTVHQNIAPAAAAYGWLCGSSIR